MPDATTTGGLGPAPEHARILLDASRRFLAGPAAATDEIIAETLAAFGPLFAADRCWVHVLGPDGRTCLDTHEWCAAGVQPRQSGLPELQLEAVPGWADRFRHGDIVVIDDRDCLPPEAAAETALMRGLDLRSLVAVPMGAGPRPAGSIGFGSAHALTGHEPDVRLVLQLLGDLFLAALERQHTAEALRRSEERADVAVRGTGVGLWDWHVQTGETSFDERWAEIIGYKLHELEPVSIDTWIRCVHPDDLAASNDRLQAHFRGETAVYECEARLRHKSGAWIWVLDRGRVFEWDAEGKPVRMAGTHLDITERKRTEEEHDRLRLELLQVQRMESMGRLAGGVAHDFNNLLTVISGYAEMLQYDGDLNQEQRDGIALIRDAAGRAQELTLQLLAFSRKQVIRPRALDLSAQISHSLKMYRRLIGEDIKLHFRPAPALPAILADEQQLDQMLGNLLVNARDALYAGGTGRGDLRITIDTKPLGIAPEDESFYGLPAGRYVLLTISDNGIGMDRETAGRIFDPFFTTKRREKGTGLGLATVLGIVQQNGGSIRVYSEPAKGTTFRIMWPAAAGPAAPPSRPDARPEALAGTETILLVEDEAGVREFTVKALSVLGYRVISAASGEDATTLLANFRSAPDLLMTDVVMPGINGREVADRARARFPGLPVLFCSGYTDDIIAHHGMLDAGVELIEKPYTVAGLTARIRALLDRA